MKNRLCVIGGATLDEYYSCVDWPAAGDKRLVRSMGRRVGGTTLNAGAVAAALGLETAMLEIVNADCEDGRFLLSEAEKLSLDCSYIIRDGAAANPKAMVFLLDSGERSIFVELARRPDSHRIDGWLPLVRDSAFLYSMPNTLTGFTGAGEFLRAAVEAGVTAVLDCDARYDDAEESLMTELCAYPIFNRASYEIFSRKHGDDAARLLLRGRARAVIHTLDRDGVRVYDRDGVTDIPPVRVSVTDTTGAGDTFGGAFVRALSMDMPARKAAEYANYAAARACTAVGATAGVCSAAELDSFIARQRT